MQGYTLRGTFAHFPLKVAWSGNSRVWSNPYTVGMGQKKDMHSLGQCLKIDKGSPGAASHLGTLMHNYGG